MGVLPCAISSAASRWAPVPQSKIRRSPPAVVSSTQEVLPPKWFVPGPGVAIDPLVPQKRTLIGVRLPSPAASTRRSARPRARVLAEESRHHVALDVHESALP